MIAGSQLASAARVTLTVSPLSVFVVFTNNDSAYQATLDLYAVGVDVSLLVDARAACNACGKVRKRASKYSPGLS